MDIEYRTKKLEKICTDASVARKVYSVKMAEKIQMRIDEIRASDSVESMIKYQIGKCHELKGDRDGQYAVNLVQPYRLIFEKKDKEITIVRIIEITDYH